MAHYKDEKKVTRKHIDVTIVNTINRQFARICWQYGVKDVDGSAYNVITHQFRHNGITDRLEASFTMEQIADMTGYHGNAMIKC